jgi:radical SAM-linked protein
MRAAEPRQRWRLVVARAAGAPDQAQRDLADDWVAAIDSAGLPVAWTEGARPRPRIAFGAPLPVGMAANAELIDVVITERWPAWRVREALGSHVPAGWQLREVQDVWIAGPPLAGRVAAADYDIVLAGTPHADLLRVAAAGLLVAPRLPRQRARGDDSVEYDLRPLLIDISIEDGPPVTVKARTRFHPELGTGRPEEVVAALSDRLGLALEIDSVVRDRLVLVEDLEPTRPTT